MHTVEVTDEMTMTDLFEVLPTQGITWIDPRYYYPFHSPYLREHGRDIQYVVTPTGILWNPLYSEVKVVDFMRMVGEQKVLYLTTNLGGFGGGGGGGVDDAMVQTALAVITLIDFTLGMYDRKQGVVSLARYIAKWISSGKKIPATTNAGIAEDHPNAFFSYLLSRKEWNPHMLANDTGVEVEQIKSFLRGFKYQYDRKTLLYVASDETPKVAEAMSGINFWKLTHEYNARHKLTG